MGINADSPIPIFQQIVDSISTAVTAGVYKPGDALPSVRQQAVMLLVNPNTVQRAYEQLERNGLLVSRRGNAPTVAEGAIQVALAHTTSAIGGAFTNGIITGRSAGLPRSQIDQLYENAWHNGAHSPHATKPDQHLPVGPEAKP
jgi:GntR family transcriptional regulator